MPKKKNGDEERLEIHIPKRVKMRMVANKMAASKRVQYVHTNVPEDKAFLTIDGRRIRNLMELVELLESMDDHAYCHHANSGRNDFSNWIRDVMGYRDLAESMMGKDRLGAEVEVLKHIVKGLV